MRVVASAEVVRGVTTNRIRMRRRSPRAELKRYRLDHSVRGLGARVVSVSMPPRELRTLDAAARRAQMSRSHFIREAAKRFAREVMS